MDREVARRCQWLWLRRGVSIAMRMSTLRPACRAWCVIEAVDARMPAIRERLRRDRLPIPLRALPFYRVRRIEAARHVLEHRLRAESQAVDCLEEFFAYGEEHLMHILKLRGLSLSRFYPLLCANAPESRRMRTLRPV